MEGRSGVLMACRDEVDVVIMDRVLPVYSKGVEEIRNLNMLELAEFRDLAKPPPSILPVYHAICILMGSCDTFSSSTLYDLGAPLPFSSTISAFPLKRSLCLFSSSPRKDMGARIIQSSLSGFFKAFCKRVLAALTTPSLIASLASSNT